MNYLPILTLLGLGGTLLYIIRSENNEKFPSEACEIDDRDSYHISRLHESIQCRAYELLCIAKTNGLDIGITSSYRSNAEQEALYNKGRTPESIRRGEQIVTKVRPGFSWHNHGLAFDVAPKKESGSFYWPNDESLWNKIGEWGKSTGLEWGGDWRSFKDRPHFQYTAGLTIQQAINGQRPLE